VPDNPCAVSGYTNDSDDADWACINTG
jgi:hypothetical protein